MKLQNNQNGFLILGDVHGIYSPFNKAVEYAQQHDLTLIAVGDLVDNGYEGEPIVSDMLKLLEKQKAYAIWGNHEWKVRRWLADNSTPVGWPSKITINQFKESAEFENNFIELCKHLHHVISFEIADKTYYISHAGFHPSYWEGEVNDLINSVFRNGMVDYSEQYEWKEQIYPLRSYSWCDYVPRNITVFVGHDPTPLNPKPLWDYFQPEPKVYSNIRNGTTVFLDCGSGKGGDLFGAVINKDNSIQYINFGK